MRARLNKRKITIKLRLYRQYRMGSTPEGTSEWENSAKQTKANRPHENRTSQPRLNWVCHSCASVSAIAYMRHQRGACLRARCLAIVGSIFGSVSDLPNR